MVAPATAELVSVLIPAHRAGAYLGATLESVAAQTWPHWEILVYEDGKFDDTAVIVRAFAARTQNRVQLLRAETNRGVSRARNALIDAARGAFIAFLDADDLWEPDHLAHSLSLLRSEDTAWSIAGLNLIDPAGRVTRRDLLPPPTELAALPTRLLEHNFILTSGIVARAAVFASGIRFDPALRIGEDLDLCIEFARAGFRPSFSQRTTLNYRKHPVSTTADPVRFPEEFSAVFEKHLGNPLVDRRICLRLLREMLLNVARMTWRRQPQRALAALDRLTRVSRFSPRALAYRLLARLRAGTAAATPATPRATSVSS
ncbi:MAG TPA: glycosyltransferase family A protein [Opitutaceae bacterium]|nr:glycosyltransferase family A protein [Opitutaceae bacterium]